MDRRGAMIKAPASLDDRLCRTACPPVLAGSLSVCDRLIASLCGAAAGALTPGGGALRMTVRRTTVLDGSLGPPSYVDAMRSPTLSASMPRSAAACISCLIESTSEL